MFMSRSQHSVMHIRYYMINSFGDKSAFEFRAGVVQTKAYFIELCVVPGLGHTFISKDAYLPWDRFIVLVKCMNSPDNLRSS